MKIAVITLHFVRHYGSLLQTYATCRLFEKLGHSAVVIDYIRPNHADERAVIREALKRKNRKSFLYGAVFTGVKWLESFRRKRFTRNFLKRFVPLTRFYRSGRELMEHPPEADVYCTGSDQVWNSQYNGGYQPEYFLEFAPEGKRRVAFSASIGMDAFPESEYDQVCSALMKYDAVSVREASAKKLLEEMGIPAVSHILDPTLCLSKAEWEPVVSRRKVHKPYILLYKLNDAPELEAFAAKLSEEKHLQIIRVSYYLNHFRLQGKMVYSPDAEEFLSLIYYADHVITDSFHCAAFSLNFEKDFFGFYPEKYSTRLSSLLKLTGTEHRAVNTAQFQWAAIDYGNVNAILDVEREKAAAFLRKALGE